MTSDKQTEANRRNAQKSTGPKTSEGKAAVRYNAIKHGLLSQDVILRGEDEAALRELDELLRDQLQPVGELESMLVDRIVANHWRLRRLGRVEAGIFSWEFYGEMADWAQEEADSYIVRRPSMAEMRREPDHYVSDTESYQEAVDKVQKMEEMQATDTGVLGRTFMRDADKGNAFSKLSRYETAIERSLYRALHELQRLQAARDADDKVTPPAAMEVDVDVTGLPREEP